MKKRNKTALALLCVVCVSVAGWAAFSFTNPYPTGGTAGTFVDTGRVLNILESNLVHVDSGGDGFVDKGTPVLLTGGKGIIGVAETSATAATSRGTVNTEGIYTLSITPDNGTLDFGELILIHTSPGAITNTTTSAIPFGYSLSETAVTSGTTLVIPIKLARDADDE